MMNFVAQAQEPNFWNAAAGSTELYIKIAFAALLGFGLILALTGLPANLRRPVVAAVTFVAGLFFVVYFLWPRPIDRQPDEMPLNGIESVSFWLEDAFPVVSTFSNVLSSFLLGLGIYSLLRVHLRRLFKKQKDWPFSGALIVALIAMVTFGYLDWKTRLDAGGQLEDQVNWTFVNYGRHFLFEGLLQQMDAAMFSIIAFFILSAAYRAFRVRSIEATILLATALIFILNLMGSVQYKWDQEILGSVQGFGENAKLSTIAGWFSSTVQVPAIRGIEFGVGIGALAMGLRLWLSLEKSGGSA